MNPKIAIGMVYTECNHFSRALLTMEHFERNGLQVGDEMCAGEKPPVLAGMCGVLERRGATLSPLLKADSVCGQALTADCYQQIKQRFLKRLRNALPVDGVLLALHGSASVIGCPDLEGDLLAAVRDIVGTDVPIVTTLDCHAHVSRQMVESADALLAWQTYPHVDAETIGSRAAKLMIRILDEGVRPAMVMAKVPVLVSGVNGHTAAPGPFAEIMAMCHAAEARDGVHSASAFLVHPYLDCVEMGGGAVVVADSMAIAQQYAGEIARAYWDRRFELEASVTSPSEAIRKGLATEGPVLLVETADCVGGGAAGDSVTALRELLKHAPDESAILPVVDPEAAAACHAHGLGPISLELGHKLDSQWGQPLTVNGTVECLSDGQFTYDDDGGFWASATHHMGPSAVLAIGEIRVLISSLSTYEWAGEQLRSVGLEAEKSKFVVVKNPMNYRQYYAHLNAEAFILDTPGPTPATVKHLGHRHMQEPFFPRQEDIPGLEPTYYGLP